MSVGMGQARDVPFLTCSLMVLMLLVCGTHEYGDPSTPAVPVLAAGPLSHHLPGKRASQGVVIATEQKYTGTMTITLSSVISVCFVVVEVETRAEI